MSEIGREADTRPDRGQSS